MAGAGTGTGRPPIAKPSVDDRMTGWFVTRPWASALGVMFLLGLAIVPVAFGSRDYWLLLFLFGLSALAFVLQRRHLHENVHPWMERRRVSSDTPEIPVYWQKVIDGALWWEQRGS